MTPQAPELLPCPFCGATPKLEIACHNFEDAQVQCECGTFGPDFDNDPLIGGAGVQPKADAIRHWNTRPTPAKRPVPQIELSAPTPDQQAFLDGLKHNTGYDPSVVIGGPRPVPQVREASETLVSNRLDEVFCQKPDDGCEWPECECRRKEPRGTFACPICGESTPHHHSIEREKREECSGCMNPACEDCFDQAALTARPSDAAVVQVREALALAIKHIEHMAPWISKQNAGYSFESLGEDMPGIRSALAVAQE